MGRNKAVELSPEEALKAKAANYITLYNEKKAIESELETLKEELCLAAKNDPDFNFELVTISKSTGKPKFDFGSLTKKAQEHVIAKLKEDLPDFVVSKSDLDVERLFFAMSTNAAIQNALKVHGIKIVDSESYSIKIVK